VTVLLSVDSWHSLNTSADRQVALLNHVTIDLKFIHIDTSTETDNLVNA